MRARLPSRKSLLVGAAGLVAAYLLFGWLALPVILQSQAEKFIAGKAGHRLSLDKPEFNPFTLSLRLRNLRLQEPDGQPLLGFGELQVEFSAASLVRRALVFNAIRLDGLEATVVERSDGRLNWSALIDALKDKDEQPAAAPPRLEIDRFVLAGGRLDFADQTVTPSFATRVEPLDVELTEISTLPDDKGQFKLTARTTFGAKVLWRGDTTLYPLAVTGALVVEDIDLSRLAPYVGGSLPVAPSAGLASFAADYRLGHGGGRVDLVLEHIAAKLSGLRLQARAEGGPALSVAAIEARNGRFEFARSSLVVDALVLSGGVLELPRGSAPPAKPLQLGSLAVEQLRVDLAGREASVGRVAAKDGRLETRRSADGRLELMDVVNAFAAAGPDRGRSAAAADRPAAAGWRYRVDKIDLENFRAAFRDETVAPPAELALDDVSISVAGLSDDLNQPLAVRASLRAASGGRFEAAGEVVPAGPSADLRLKLADLALGPAQPYLASLARLKLVGGRLSTQGRATYGAKGVGYRGDFALRDLRLDEAGTNHVFLAWKSLDSRELDLSAARLNIAQLGLDGLDTQLIIDKDKSVNLAKILRSPAATPPTAARTPATAKTDAASPFRVNIDRLRITRGEMDFADNSLALPFGTRIHDLKGSINGLSSRPGAPAQVEVDGQVDDYGLARAVGQIDLFNPSDFTDLKVLFRNVEMTRLTPYSATFAGRKIASGKLSLDLEYKIDKHQLHGDNKIIMDQLTLGERVEAPEAKNLPLDLAIAILQDSDGRIDLGLPVAGSLDDPQFSYGQIVWKAILNVMTKIVTAPFRALGALFGGGEKFENIAFEAGEAQLTPPEREKLVRLAGALHKRPGLSLAVHGVYAEADRVALQDLQLRRKVAERMGQRVDAQGDPGPLSTRQPKVQSVLESLYAEAFGGAELAALKDGFRRANPGELAEGPAGKMMSRLSGLFRDKRTLSDEDVAQLKGIDFHALLFERLRDKEAVGDERLLALAKARGESTAAALQAAGAPADRLALLAAEKVDSSGRDVPLKLVLGAAGKSATAAAQ